MKAFTQPVVLTAPMAIDLRYAFEMFRVRGMASVLRTGRALERRGLVRSVENTPPIYWVPTDAGLLFVVKNYNAPRDTFQTDARRKARATRNHGVRAHGVRR